MAKQLYPNDARFFEGYVWLYENPENPRLGLCYEAATAEAAFAKYVDRVRCRRTWDKGRVLVMYSLDRPDGVPVRHETVQ